MKTLWGPILGLCAALVCAPVALADDFGSGANSFSIEFVTIGNPGNPADTTGSPNPAGSVPYAYRMGKYEISRQMVEKASTVGDVDITLADMTANGGNGPSRPATVTSWFEAAKFVNWLNTSKGFTPAYKFDASGDFQLWASTDAGYDPGNLFRNSQSVYFLPSADEWYKAAYYDPAVSGYWNYAVGNNVTPSAVGSGTSAGTIVYHQPIEQGPTDVMVAGGLSPYGTMAQNGNVLEWEETEADLVNDSGPNFRIIRGGNWNSSFSSLWSFSNGSAEPNAIGGGFRVATVIPEPTSAALLAVLFMSLGPRLRRRDIY